MAKSRTQNVLRNISWAVPLQVILMLLQFVARTYFVCKLGREYLGINGLFADIIWILDLANLGIPDAIIICMYKPLAEKNNEKVRALLYFIRKAYSIIGLVVMGLGLLIIPLLPFFIKDPPNIPEKFVVIYLFYLVQSVLSYYISYKRTVIFADQKDYIVTIYQKIFHFIQISVQIVILITIKNFYIYLLVQVICVLLNNLLTSRKAEKLYPYIKEKNSYILNKDEIAEIVTNIKSMCIYGVGTATLIGIDSILVSSIVGIGILGLCSNYMLIVTSVKMLIDQAMRGFTASIGNFNVNENKEIKENAFYQVFFIVFAINAFFAVNLAVSLNSLITVWFGESFLLAQTTVITLLLRFYVQGTQYVTFTFRSTLGLLKKWKFIPLITAFVNITSAIILGRIFGASGVFFASSLAIFFFTIIPEAILLYKYKFEKKPVMFIIRYFGYILFIACSYFITNLVLEQFSFIGWKGFIVKAFLGAVISGVLFIAVFFWTKNFRSLIDRLIYNLKNKNPDT